MNISATLGRVWRWLRFVLLGLLILAIAYLSLGTYLALKKDKSDASVAVIHAQHITLADVQGTNLPPTPNEVENNATVAGIDENNNGIRDDVELAIFQKYPGVANEKIRAAELQYAMTEQMYLTRVFDTATWKAVAEESGRADLCAIDNKISLAEEKNIEGLTFNTAGRQASKEKAFEFTTSYGPAAGKVCDVSL